jgi:cytochrome c oxidase subunit 3
VIQLDRMAASVTAERAGPQASPILFGTIVFLASEALFFGGLFAAYFALRARTEPWPPAGVELGTLPAAVGTGLLMISSLTMQGAVIAGQRRRLGSMRAWIAVSMALGAAFLGVQLYDYGVLPFTVASHAYGTMYVAMTGVHGLHVLAGLILMLVMLGRMAQGAYRDGRIDGAHAIAYYWHFVDAVWIGLFATLFLVR